MSRREDFKILTQKAHETLRQNSRDQIISAVMLDKFDDNMESAKSLTLKWENDKFDGLIEGNKKLSDKGEYDISVFTALTSLMQNALNNARFGERRLNTEERVENFLHHLLRENPADKQDVVDRLVEIKKDMVISLVHTMHPTIYHTYEARTLEKELTAVFSDKSLNVGQKIKRADTHLKGFIAKLKSGKVTITPDEETTIATENKVSEENLDQIEKLIHKVTESWNKAVEKTFSGGRFPGLKGKEALKFSEKEIKGTFELRDWTRGADGDGREKATALLLGETIFNATEGYTKPFKGATLDLRQNAEVFGLGVNSFIQILYRDSAGFGHIPSNDGKAFKGFAEEFVEKAKAAEIEPLDKDWSSRKRLFIEMPEIHQKDFIREIILKDIELVPGEIKAYSVAFAKQYPKIFREFVDSKKEFLETVNVEAPKEYSKMWVIPSDNKQYKTMANEFKDYVASKEISYEFEGKPKKINIRLDDEDGLYFQPAQSVIGHEFLKGIKKLDKNGGGEVCHEDLSYIDRSNIMNLVKRLCLISDAIDRDGDKVADRHQVANFGKVQHFYNCMALMKEADLIQVEDGKVHRVKMKIMPLLETIEDQERFVPIFKELLKDPLSKSYFEKTGADFMIGFSDGSKSAGNFASERSAYNTKKQLQQICDEHDISCRFLDGRGRRLNRGGLPEAGTFSVLLPDNVAKHPIMDVTIQSDLPSHMATAGDYGRDQLASMVIGTMNAALNAGKHSPLQEKYDKAIDWIANRSKEVFQQLVKNNPDTGIFIEAMPSNGDISSRKQSRPERKSVNGNGNGHSKPDGKKIYDDKRAVPIEFASLISMAGFHDVGLNTALKEFIEKNPVQIIKGDRELNGREVLKELTKDKWFGEQIKRRYEGMEDYNPEVAKKYAQKTGNEKFIDTVTNAIGGLKTLLADVIGIKKETETKNFDKNRNSIGYSEEALGYMAQSVILSRPELKPKDNRDDTTPKMTIRNSLFSISQEAFNKVSTQSKYFEMDSGKTL